MFRIKYCNVIVKCIWGRVSYLIDHKTVRDILSFWSEQRVQLKFSWNRWHSDMDIQGLHAMLQLVLLVVFDTDASDSKEHLSTKHHNRTLRNHTVNIGEYIYNSLYVLPGYMFCPFRMKESMYSYDKTEYLKFVYRSVRPFMSSFWLEVYIHIQYIYLFQFRLTEAHIVMLFTEYMKFIPTLVGQDVLSSEMLFSYLYGNRWFELASK